MRGRKTRLSVKRVEAALEATGGIRAAAAQKLGVGRSSLYRFFGQHPQLIEFANAIDEEIKDLAESKMLQLLRSGDRATVLWFLELKAKDRGYSRRVETTGPNGGPVEVNAKVDLSIYTDEELDILARAAARGQALKDQANFGENLPAKHGYFLNCDCRYCRRGREAREAIAA